MNDPVARLQSLRKAVETGRDAKARAEAVAEQAQGQLAAILAQHQVSSVDELAARVEQARQAAEVELAKAEAILGATA